MATKKRSKVTIEFPDSGEFQNIQKAVEKINKKSEYGSGLTASRFVRNAAIKAAQVVLKKK